MDTLLEIARRRNLAVIEDACEAIGAEYAGRKVGTFGDVGVFAFYPNKQMTTGEGGVVVARSDAVAAHIRSLRNQGRGAQGEWFEHTEVGYNYRLSDVACALGLSQLSRLESMLARREAVARRYDERLRTVADLVRPPLDLPRRRVSWFVCVARLSARFGATRRDAVRDRLVSHGIGCGRYFAPIHLQPAYRSHEDARSGSTLAITEAEAERCLALPFFNKVTDLEMDEVCDRLRGGLESVVA
jgi:perosamine synthetase